LVCREILQRPICQDPVVRLHFIEAAADVLAAAAADQALARWKLYQAAWYAPGEIGPAQPRNFTICRCETM
jgi:hypothetical protein